MVSEYGKYVRFSKVKESAYLSSKETSLSSFKIGVGYAAAIIAFWLNCYYIVVLAWGLYYAYNSVISSSSLPWITCNNWWNLPTCRTLTQMRNYSTSMSCSTTTVSKAICLKNATEHLSQFTSPVKEFWEYVSQPKRSILTRVHVLSI